MRIVEWLRRCRHRTAQLRKDERTYTREVTDDGETIKTWERKECRCGVVIEHVTETTNINRTTVSVPPAVAVAEPRTLVSGSEGVAGIATGVKSLKEKKMKRITHYASLITLLLLLACGSSGFAGTLRGLLAASPVFFDSLQLGDKRAAVVADFTDLSNDAMTLGDDLKACADDKPCKVNAIDRFKVRFWDVLRRGHFKLSPKLERVERAITGVIEAAKIYYGARSKSGAEAVQARDDKQTVADLKTALEELKAATRP